MFSIIYIRVYILIFYSKYLYKIFEKIFIKVFLTKLIFNSKMAQWNSHDFHCEYCVSSIHLCIYVLKFFDLFGNILVFVQATRSIRLGKCDKQKKSNKSERGGVPGDRKKNNNVCVMNCYHTKIGYTVYLYVGVTCHLYLFAGRQRL